MQKSICVYSSSSDAISPAYFQTADELGTLIARRRHTLVYGGSNIGLMGALARAVHSQNGKVVGVIPESIRARGVAYESADELIVTADLRERKAIMERRSDAFIALPGGFGTLEEVSEMPVPPVIFRRRGRRECACLYRVVSAGCAGEQVDLSEQWAGLSAGFWPSR